MKTIPVRYSGRSGEWVYYMRGRKQCRRRYVVPKDPRTPAQLRVRATFGAASHYWSHTLDISEAQRDAWEAAANKRKSRPRLGQSGPLTGQQYFMAKACRWGRGSPSCLPVPGAFQPWVQGIRPSDQGAQSPPHRQSGKVLPYTGTTWGTRRTCEGHTCGHARRASIPPSFGSGVCGEHLLSGLRRPGPFPVRPARISLACPSRTPCGSRPAPGAGSLSACSGPERGRNKAFPLPARLAAVASMVSTVLQGSGASSPQPPPPSEEREFQPVLGGSGKMHALWKRP